MDDNEFKTDQSPELMKYMTLSDEIDQMIKVHDEESSSSQPLYVGRYQELHSGRLKTEQGDRTSSAEGKRVVRLTFNIDSRNVV